MPETDVKTWEALPNTSPAPESPTPSNSSSSIIRPAPAGTNGILRIDAKHDAQSAIAAPQITTMPLDIAANVFASGLNGALRRTPKLECENVPLLGRVTFSPRWRPTSSGVRTTKLTFPDGMEFLPPPKSPEESENLKRIKPPKARGGSEREKPKPTRIKPPSDALSLEDRLFYVLQPPLETWLAGQELIMPFEPFPYQYEGIGWMFSQKAALLADEMGLGKTMQTITAIRLLLRSGQVRRVLLVCPKPLIPNWQREFKLWAEELPITTLEGDSARRNMLWNMPGVPILLANYEVVVRDFETFGDDPPKYDLVILDEAQRIKNRDSRTAAMIRSIPRRRSWTLTGTPIENRPEELASLFEFMEVIPPRSNPDMKGLTQLADHYILRRTKDLVMSDLPPRLDRDAHLDLNPAQQHAYDTAERDGVIQLNEMGESISVQHVFELVLRLKQITNFDPLTGDSAKLDRLEADMEEISNSGGKAILFSQWTKCIDWLDEKLKRFNPLVYHGKVPTKKREPILSQFKEDPNCPLLLMSYGTGAVGLNLQFAGYVFLYDRWWNPAVEDQAINRAHRVGQKSQVIVTKFICNNTIEERIDRVLNEKRQIFARVLGDGDSTIASLSLNASEIFGLFDLKARQGEGTRKIAPKAEVENK
ncbi:ATP-dependent helicase HepA [Symmachiella dynata]|uniref:DEAD/DEAH box helicase n=1 Tax=Symmachiella dynata TaxID=2527995 RepID=UPI001188CA2B|nr:DEAD/DEAH box helicase [Symmachiella dynata]QDT49292.1 ATP-dependent helicase HepA [Symmachiella dynata]